MVRLLELIIGKTARSFLGGLILGRRFLRGSIWNVNTICIYAMRYGWGERKHRGASASMGDLVRSSGGVTGQAAHSPIQPSICASQIGESVRGSRYQNEWSAWLPSPVPKSERPFGKLRAGSGAPASVDWRSHRDRGHPPTGCVSPLGYLSALRILARSSSSGLLPNASRNQWFASVSNPCRDRLSPRLNAETASFLSPSAARRNADAARL